MAEKPELQKCTSCGAPIFFAPTAATGSLMPIDAEPVPGGNVVLDADGRAVVAKGELWDAESPDPKSPRYRSHFVTCPNRRQHRRRK